MNIYIGENIKRLRKEKDLTQEKLAEYLNISCQAISKWERNESYPDITMIIPIASYFGVSTDELLGLDAVKNEQKIKEYLDEYYKLGALGKEFEKFDLMRKAYKEFPNDFRIVEEYAWQLNYDPHYCDNHYGNEVHKEELYRICKRILDDCTLDLPRYSALSILGGLYLLDGDINKALETSKKFPNHYYFTANEECENIYDRGTDEWWPWVQKNIQDLTDCLTVKIRNCALYSNLPPEKKILIFKKAITILETIYDEGDYNFYNYTLAELNILIANRYIEMVEYDIAWEYLDKGLNFAKACDELPQKVKHISFLVNRLTQDMMNISSGFEGNDVARELDYLCEDNFYKQVREMDGFKNVIDKYKPFAKSEKRHE